MRGTKGNNKEAKKLVERMQQKLEGRKIGNEGEKEERDREKH